MCGITGFRLHDGSTLPEQLATAVEALRHRGPDDHGSHVSSVAGVGMRRLAIVAIATGQQPLTSEDGRYVLVGNGEIYNAPTFRRDLEDAGHRFAGGSDIEVVLHGYEEHGTNVFEYLNGMFAIAILDTHTDSIVIARDRLGIKPLFLCETASGVAFASEIPAIVESLQDHEPRLDRWALRDYLSLGYVPAPRTIYSSIRRLPPGHWAEIDEHGVRMHSWWSLPDLVTHSASDDRNAEDWAEEVELLLRDSVRLRTLGDVPAGAFLSGGLDSSTLVAMLTEASSAPVPCFTIAVDDPDLNEVEDARRTAQYFGCEHHVEVMNNVDMDELTTLFRAFGEPFADVSLLPSHRVAALARRHVKFVLSGDGGDELFCGYSWLLREARWRRLPKTVLGAARWLSPILTAGQRVRRADMVGKALRAAGDIASTPVRSFLRRRSLCHPTVVEELLHPRLKEHWGSMPPSSLERHVSQSHGESTDDFGLLVDLDRRYYLSGDILEKVDRATMMHSLEARVPFLDHRLVELCARIPVETHLGPLGRGKDVLRRVIRRTLPSHLLGRKKRGFGIPVDRWFREHLFDDVRDRLSDRRFRQAELISAPRLDAILEEHRSGYANHGHLLWALLSLAVWHTESSAKQMLPL